VGSLPHDRRATQPSSFRAGEGRSRGLIVAIMPLVGVALLLTACPSSEPPAERPEDLQAEFVSAMHGRRDAVRGIHDAIVAGDLEGARTAAGVVRHGPDDRTGIAELPL